MSSSSKLLRKHINEPWFSLIMIRSKTIEGRLNQGDWAEIREGDRRFWIQKRIQDSDCFKKCISIF